MCFIWILTFFGTQIYFLTHQTKQKWHFLVAQKLQVLQRGSHVQAKTLPCIKNTNGEKGANYNKKNQQTTTRQSTTPRNTRPKRPSNNNRPRSTRHRAACPASKCRKKTHQPPSRRREHTGPTTTDTTLPTPSPKRRGEYRHTAVVGIRKNNKEDFLPRVVGPGRVERMCPPESKEHF